MKVTLFFVFVFAAVIAFAQPTKQYATQAQRKEFYQQLGKKYSSAAVQEIFTSDKTGLFDQYVDGRAEQDLVNSYGTVIHELLHGYNTGENGGYYYFVEPGIRIFVPCGKYYNSTELNAIVRKGQQDSIFRYQLYVGGKQTLPGHGGLAEDGFSIVRGIYGLLDEYSAYYYGGLTSYELYPYYLAAHQKGNTKALEAYKNEVMGDVMAYHEFKLFLSWYMVFAQQKHPDVYADILGNKPLRVVFTLIEEKFRTLAAAVDVQMVDVDAELGPNLLEVLDLSGSDEDIYRLFEYSGMQPEQLYKVEQKVVDGKTVTVKTRTIDAATFAELKKNYQEMIKMLKAEIPSDLMVYFAQPRRQITYLKRQLTPAAEAAFEKLKIAGVTTANYEAYLK